MSRFYEELEREQILRTPASLWRTTADRSGTPAPGAPGGAVRPRAPSLLEPPVLRAPASATASMGDRSDRVAAHLVSLLDPASFEAEQYRVLRHVVETLRKGANLQVVAVTSPGV